MADRTEQVLVDLYEKMFAAGARAGKSRRPEVRDAYFGCAALVAEECLKLGAKHPDKTLAERIGRGE